MLHIFLIYFTQYGGVILLLTDSSCNHLGLISSKNKFLLCWFLWNRFVVWHVLRWEYRMRIPYSCHKIRWRRDLSKLCYAWYSVHGGCNRNHTSVPRIFFRILATYICHVFMDLEAIFWFGFWSSSILLTKRGMIEKGRWKPRWRITFWES